MPTIPEPACDELRVRIVMCAESIRLDDARHASSLNLTTSEHAALAHLVQRKPPTQPSHLALLLGCSRANVTKITKKLVAANYVEERRHPILPSRKMLTVTDAGHRAFAEAKPRARAAEPSFSRREQQQLQRLLDRFHESLLAAREAASPQTLAGGSRSPSEPLSPAEVVHRVNRSRRRKQFTA